MYSPQANNRVSRRGFREASFPRHTATVTPCLHQSIDRDFRD